MHAAVAAAVAVCCGLLVHWGGSGLRFFSFGVLSSTADVPGKISGWLLWLLLVPVPVAAPVATAVAAATAAVAALW